MSNELISNKIKFSTAIRSDTYQQLIKQTLGDENRARKFVAGISSAVATNKTLQECTPASILGGALVGESLNLLPSPQLGHYYLLPYNDKNSGNKLAQFQIGYKGYLQLAMRSGFYRDIDVTEVREGEYLGRDKQTGKPKFEFIENEKEFLSKKVVGYKASFEYLNGFTKVLYWSKEKMLEHADKYSKAFNAKIYEKLLEGKIPEKDLWKYSSFWYKDFDGMAFKTMLRQLISKWGIMSTEMAEAFEKDMATIDTNGEFNYIDNEEENIDIVEQNEIQDGEIFEAEQIEHTSEEVNINEI